MTSYGAIGAKPDEVGHEESSQPRESTPLLSEKGVDGSEADGIGFGFPPQMPHAQQSSSMWSKLTFGWVNPLLQLGNTQQRLDPSDLKLIPLPADCETQHLSSEFDKCWKEELTKPTPRLIVALLRAFGYDFLVGGFVLKLIHDCCIFVGPQVLNAMIIFLRNADAPLSDGLYLTLCVTLSQLTMSFCLRHYFFKCYLFGLKVRTAVVVAVYQKALVLASGERQTRTLGEITNLISIDAQRLQDLTTYLHAVWYSFVQISLCIYFLWQQLGVSSLGGVVVIICMMPVTKAVARWMGGMQKRLMKARDERVEVNSEVLGSMKVIKLQAWEESFQNSILRLRENELKQLFHYIIANSFSIMLWSGTPLTVALATFAAYVLSGHKLEVASALTSLALFDILRFPLFMLPQIINRMVEASISLGRVKSFLMCDEHHSVGPDDLSEIGISMENVSAVYESQKPRLDANEVSASTKELAERNWEVSLLRSQLQEAEQKIKELTTRESSTELGGGSALDFEMENATQSSMLCLKRIDLQCKPGEIVAVVGAVGCGKSSLINAILGEVRQLAGQTKCRGKLAYFAQSPFILNATVKTNIIFGHADEPVDEDRYQRTLDCCALRHDLSLLPAGDQTEIGEKGITLSGGQKARVALARAVYHNADITLIDDALCAVDAHVAKHLFEECIVDELMRANSSEDSQTRKRSVVLATNALQYLNHPRVDRILVIRDGRVAEQGTFKQLSEDKKSLFSRFLFAIDDNGISADMLGASATTAVDEGVAKKQTKNTTVAVAADSDVKKLKKATSSRLMKDEERATGHVSLDVYLTWARAAGGIWIPLVIIVAFGAVECVNVGSKWFLTYWSQHGGDDDQYRFLAMYGLINLIAILAAFGRVVLIMVFGLKASRRLFAEMLDVVLQVPMSFFDTTPIGRVINRFSKDSYEIDEKLMMALRSYLSTVFTIVSTIAVVSSVTPMFAICLIPIIIYYAIQQNFFTVTYRELKRLDSVSRSPIYALLGESIDGVATIRAFSAESALSNRLTAFLNMQQNAYFLTCTAQCWLAVRLEVVGTIIVTAACLAGVWEHRTQGGNEAFAGLVGLSISFALSVTQALNWSVRMASDLEASMVAVERVKEYCGLEHEGLRKTDADETLPKDWPSGGEIVFEDVQLRYRQGLPLVLKGLNLHIPAKSKIGVVGRTGAGKSTLMLSILRIIELDSGKMFIDGVDIRTLGLAKLRSNIAVIPQDPVLFSGTIRSNMDPFNEYSDSALRDVLVRVGLFKTGTSSTSTNSLASMSMTFVNSLLDPVREGGSNFSVGQRQLLVIARALLRGSTIVIMDEATAAVDADTDGRIQKVMRNEFADATCITIAHRINTIMDNDFILVMDDGRAAEFDSPKKLLSKGGMFRDLVEAASKAGSAASM